VFIVTVKGCVKVWDIRDLGCKSPVSQLDCLVSDVNFAANASLQTMIVCYILVDRIDFVKCGSC